MSFEDNRLGEYVRAQRELINISIRQLAERAGLHFTFLSRIENGSRKKIDPADLQRIADALGVDSSELLELVGVKPAAVLPLKTYFRRRFGVNADEAEILAGLIEEYQAKQGGKEET